MRSGCLRNADPPETTRQARRDGGMRRGQKRVRQERASQERASRQRDGHRRLPEVGDCRSWVPSPVAPRGRAIQCKMHDGRSSCRRRKSSAREPFFVGATRVATGIRKRTSLQIGPKAAFVRDVRPPSAPHVVGGSSRLASLPQKTVRGLSKTTGCGVRRVTPYFSSTRSMRNANAPCGCPAVNAMARTRARSAPLKPFSGTRISFHSGPASKVCMLGICCEPWNSIS